MENLKSQTLAQIVTDHYQAAEVFEKYGLDFCCKGKRSLETACQEKQLPLDNVMAELEESMKGEEDIADFNAMSLTQLADFIVRVHHTYVKFNLPQIFSYVHRVASKHGHKHPEMIEVFELVAVLRKEMEEHMMKEEQILFPRIKQLEVKQTLESLKQLESPIGAMEDDHELVGGVTQKIRELTENYTPPVDACTTYKLALASLQAFETDLHQHVHLENNILFPKAIELYKQHNTASLN